MGIILYGNTFTGNVLINNHIIEENLQLFFDPNNDRSYNGNGSTVYNIAPEATSNNISGSLDVESMYIEGINNSSSYFRVRSDTTVERMDFSDTVSRPTDEESTVMFYFWSDYDATGQYGNSQAFFGGKYTNYMAITGGSNGTYGVEAESDGIGFLPDQNHDYFARTNDNTGFITGSWSSWTSVFSGSKAWNYFNGTLGTTRDFNAPSTAVHSFNRLGSNSTGVGSTNRGGDIRMGALLIYDRALTSGEVAQNLDVLNRRFRN